MRKIKVLWSIRHLQNLIYAVLSSGAVILTACDNDNIWTHANNISDDTDQYCQEFTEPFLHHVCAVDSQALLKSKSDKQANNVKNTSNHDATNLSLRLFWRQGNDNTNQDAQPLFTFTALKQSLNNHEKLLFASNAGMYNHNFAPIGYTVIDGKQVLSLNRNQGEGNFHLLPNGVFWWDNEGFYIDTTEQMHNKLTAGIQPKFATQSGPMLVIDGKIHPKFKANSSSKKIRTGIGIAEDGKIKLVHSRVPVNFYEFALLFQTKLNCKNALFLDGGIASALYAPALKIDDKRNMGVMIGLVKSESQ